MQCSGQFSRLEGALNSCLIKFSFCGLSIQSLFIIHVSQPVLFIWRFFFFSTVRCVWAGLLAHTATNPFFSSFKGTLFTPGLENSEESLACGLIPTSKPQSIVYGANPPINRTTLGLNTWSLNFVFFVDAKKIVSCQIIGLPIKSFHHARLKRSFLYG